MKGKGKESIRTEKEKIADARYNEEGCKIVYMRTALLGFSRSDMVFFTTLFFSSVTNSTGDPTSPRKKIVLLLSTIFVDLPRSYFRENQITNH